MARADLSLLLRKLRGQVGDLVVRQYGDRIVVSRKPKKSETPPSPAQMATRQRFRKATDYGNRVMADPEGKARYEAMDRPGTQSLFSLIVADFLNPPSVQEVDLSGYAGAPGDRIVIHAKDDIGVRSVSVALTDAVGRSIESDAAVNVPSGTSRWEYVAQAAIPAGTTVRVAVTATDAPGGTGRAECEKTV